MSSNNEEEKLLSVSDTNHTPNDKSTVYKPNDIVISKSYIKSLEEYKSLYNYSITNNLEFWDKMAKSELDWFIPYRHVMLGGFKYGDYSWFTNGQLNASYNCIDRHIEKYGDKVALLWEGDEPNNIRKITYNELLREVCKLSNSLIRNGIKKGETVCIYMPMIPEAVIAMLACARIGCPHAVVFAGFSVESLRDRIIDGNCVAVITSDEGKRGSKHIPLKKVVDKALMSVDPKKIKKVYVYQHTNCNDVIKNFNHERDIWYHDAIAMERPYCPPVYVDSEDPLFMLFTSGSTGRPKGIQHSTAGYLLYTKLTHKYIFDVQPDDIYACVADIGWITGHSYVVYGPLLNGSTTFLFESIPTYPDHNRYWDVIQRHKINIFYTSPTAIRSLMKFGVDSIKKYDLSSIRILGTVGEPINPEAWRWLYENIGRKTATIVDTYWQTETGGIVISALPGSIPTKPGSATLPFFGIEPVLLDEKGHEIQGNNVSGFLAFKHPWPGQSRTCWGDHNRFMQTYLTPYDGYYFTGDGAIRDLDGYYWITGRVDDVINVSGHRIGSAEIESALVSHGSVAEAAVIGVPHDIKGQALFAYVTLKEGIEITDMLKYDLLLAVARDVGSFAKPDTILITPSLPKTRSGKIMRRLLRKIACQETSSLGDLSTLSDSQVIYDLIDLVNNELQKKKR